MYHPISFLESVYDYEKMLFAIGYKPHVVRLHLHSVAHFGIWLEQKGIEPNQRIFGLTYQGARAVVNKAGKLVGIHLRPHDLRRHAATHASRSGTPIEIVSKVILRHANLSTTQRYLGKVSELEALGWIENVYA